MIIDTAQKPVCTVAERRNTVRNMRCGGYVVYLPLSNDLKLGFLQRY